MEPEDEESKEPSTQKTDFKKLMPLTLEMQKKKNQIGDQTIAERADESDEENQAN